MNTIQNCLQASSKKTKHSHLPIKDLVKKEELSACDKKYLSQASQAMSDLIEFVNKECEPALKGDLDQRLAKQFESIITSSPDFYSQVSEYLFSFHKDPILSEHLKTNIISHFEEAFEHFEEIRSSAFSEMNQVSKSLNQLIIESSKHALSPNTKMATESLMAKKEAQSVIERKVEVKKAIEIIKKGNLAIGAEELEAENEKLDSIYESYSEKKRYIQKSPAVKAVISLLDIKKSQVKVSPREVEEINHLAEHNPEFLINYVDLFEKINLVFGNEVPADRIYDDEILEKRSIYDSVHVVHSSIIKAFPQAKELSSYNHSSRQYMPVKGDIVFGSHYFISQKGDIYDSKLGHQITKAGRSGFYLVSCLIKDKSKKLGKKDFQPKNKESAFAWSTIKKAKRIIIKACGDVIGTDVNGEYFYAY